MLPKNLDWEAYGKRDEPFGGTERRELPGSSNRKLGAGRDSQSADHAGRDGKCAKWFINVLAGSLVWALRTLFYRARHRMTASPARELSSAP
jgi:hypothetical protein